MLKHGALKKFVLGSAQFGMNYGINNLTKLNINAISSILDQANEAGITKIDTARAYGDSESILGSTLSALDIADNFLITTKLSPLPEFEGRITAPTNSLKTAIEISIQSSIKNLQIESIDCLLLHRATHLFYDQGFILKELIKLKEIGVINSIGVSVQNPTELKMALQCAVVSQIQMPFNILDYRWSQSIKLINQEKKKRQISIYTRSAFLQGLLLVDEKRKWMLAHASKEHNAVMDALKHFKIKFHRKSLSDLLINYVLGHSWVDGVVIGVDNCTQLAENIEIFKNQVLSQEELKYIYLNRPNVSNKTLNPALWRW
jgi:aryl-alcohol dehydrogenase-like predicted oxidoreductase